MTDPANVPQIQDKRPRITGLLPKNAQNMVLGGVALVMILVILFSNRTAPKHVSTAIPTTSIPGPNQTHIQDFRAHMEDETRKLAAEEAELAQARKALSAPERTATRGGTTGSYSSHESIGSAPQSVGVTPSRREAESLFASNVALTHRRLQSESPKAPESSAGQNTPASVSNRGADVRSGTPATYRLVEGTILETVLTNRLDSSFSGPVNCMVTTNIYSHDGMKLLIPQGSRVLGEVRKVESLGEQRVAVTFHRLIMPNGFSANLDQFKGLDQVGETGLRDQVNHHYLQVFGVSIAIGGLAGLSQANTRYGLEESASDAYRQGVSDSLSQSAMRVLDRYLNVPPTFTVREGYRVKVYLSQDLQLPAYDPQPAESDF